MGELRNTVCENELDKRVPANDADVKQVCHPQQFPQAQSDEHGDHLNGQYPTRGTKQRSESAHQRVYFKRPEVKCDESCGQIERLEHEEAGLCLHYFPE